MASLKKKVIETIQISDDKKLFVSEEPAGYIKSEDYDYKIEDISN